MEEAEVRAGITAGVALALKRANKWSDGRVWPGDTGAENLLQVSIAEKIYGAAKVVLPVIELEATLGRLGVQGGDRRRVDVALMRKADGPEQPHPFCIVEVKKAPVAFTEDLSKIETLLNEVETIRYAFLATYFQHRIGANRRARSRETVLSDLDGTVREAARKHALACRKVEARFLGHSVFDDEGHRHCAGAVIHRFGREI